MRIGVISDTHIIDKTKTIPEEIINTFKGVDLIVHAGDMVDLSVLEQLRSACSKVIAVCGNMDNETIKKKYPQKVIFKAGKYKIGLMHGSGAPANLVEILLAAFKDDKPDMIIFGHSHSAFNETIEGILFFNPGSACDKSINCNSYGIIEINDKIESKIIKIN